MSFVALFSGRAKSETEMTTTLYATLGLTKQASDAEIKKAYRKIARENHPDLNPSDATAEERFKAAAHAYDLLKDPEKRRRYDAGEIDESGAEQAPRGYYRQEARRPENPYTQSGAGFRGNSSEEAFDADDFFAHFARSRGGAGFGGGSRREQPMDIPGQDARYRLSVSFLDAALGAKTRITLPDGSDLEVSIPEGARDGQTLRLRGKGEAGYGNGHRGDALITLSVAPHPEFTPSDDDILSDLSISIDEAVLGGKVKVKTLSGAVNVTVPPGANSGQVLRLKGRGLKAKTGGRKGDQLVKLRIVTPPKIDSDLKEFMEKWRTEHAYDPRAGKVGS